MLHFQQPTYILHTRPYRETSLLLECLTREYGRLGVVARGVRRPRITLLRSVFEPFQPLRMDFQLRGELGTLQSAEQDGAPLRLPGVAGLAGLYLNELLIRLTPRQDPCPALFDAYAKVLPRLLEDMTQLGWQLRRFERDLLSILGYGLLLDRDADSGEPLCAEHSYQYLPGHGPVRCHPTQRQALRGSALLALMIDHRPEDGDLTGLRRLMREVIRFHLGGGELRAWSVLAAAMHASAPRSPGSQSEQ